VLRVNGLWKSYGPVAALRGVGFSLEKGRITALLGENGAGKTTTLRIILGFLEKDAGTVELDAGQVGYVPDHPVFLPWLSGRAILDISRRLSAVGRPEWEPKIRGLCGKLLFDSGLLDRRPRTYSAGNVKKFAFLQSLALDPELLIVDEPFSALDPPSIKRTRDLFQEMRARGAALLLSSHMLAEMARISDDFIILRRGEAVAAPGSPSS